MTHATDENSTSKKERWEGAIQDLDAQRQIRERKLLETAARLFNRYGFHGTSTSKLTSDLGLTKGALYHYVKDKSDLLYRIHIESAAASRQAVERAIRDGSNGYERTVNIVKYYLMAVTRSPIETFLLLEDGALDSDRSTEIKRLRKSLNRSLEKQIEAGIEDGSIAPCDAKMATFILVGAMAWVSKWYRPEGTWSADQVTQGMANQLGRMLREGIAHPSPTVVSEIENLAE